MAAWSVQNAKAHFSEMLDTCLEQGAQVVTKRGKEAAVLLSFEEWKRLVESARPSLKSLLLSDHSRFEMELPVRGQSKRRTPVEF